MSQSEFRGAGLDKLSPGELKALDDSTVALQDADGLERGWLFQIDTVVLGTRRHVPDADRAVVPARGEPRAITIECDAEYRVLMSGDHRELSVGASPLVLHPPQMDLVVAAAGGQHCTIVPKCDPANGDDRNCCCSN